MKNNPTMAVLALFFHLIHENLKFFSDKYGLSRVETSVIMNLYYRDNLTLTELSESQGIPKSSMSRVVDEMVNKGFIDRKIPANNRRIVQLSIADKYKDIFNEHEQFEMLKKFRIADYSPEMRDAAEILLNDFIRSQE